MNATLQIQAALRNGVTYLKESYTTSPFKVANITEDKLSGWLRLMMMCSSPGILDGDEYEVNVSLEENCRLHLHTQSYQRLFQMTKGASQQMRVNVKCGGFFIYLPHPTVPHSNSIFSAHNKIYLKQNSSLIWGEILTCGRQLKDEVFTLSRYHNLTEVFINNRLTIKENLLLQPSLVDVKGMGLLEGFTHQASFLCIREFGSLPEIMNTVYDYLSLQTNILSGVTKAPGKGFIVRILGYKAEQLHDCLKHIANIVQSMIEETAI